MPCGLGQCRTTTTCLIDTSKILNELWHLPLETAKCSEVIVLSPYGADLDAIPAMERNTSWPGWQIVWQQHVWEAVIVGLLGPIMTASRSRLSGMGMQ